MDGNCTSDERSWQKANTWLAEMLSYPDEAAGYIEKIRTFSRLASVGIEGLTPEDARVKFYWRLKKAIKISDGGLPLLGNELFSHFSSIIAEKRRMKLDGLVFGTGFNLASGRLVDSKLDICCAECCLDFSKDVWLKKLRRLGNAFHLKVPDMEEALLLEYCRGVLIGMGLDKNGGIRSNLYLKRV